MMARSEPYDDDAVTAGNYAQADATPDGIHLHGVSEGYAIDEVTVPWATVLAHAPRAALVAALVLRPGVESHVLGTDTTLRAEFVTLTRHRMDRDKETVTGPCTVIVVSPEGA
jgi:hypothetical protein